MEHLIIRTKWANCRNLRFALILSLAFSQVAVAQSRQEKAVINQIDKHLIENNQLYAPGSALLIAKNGKIFFEKGYGTANLELNVPMKPDMVFRIGSITKQFTAVAILQLVEQGKLTLNDSIQKFIKNYHYKGRKITIENLLTHTSGIKGYEGIDAKVPNAIRVDFKPEVLIDSLDKLPLDFLPGSKYQYSNSNYFLLGKIIETISGMSYQQYLKRYIFEPAGLTSTYYDSHDEIIKNRVNGYTNVDGNYKNAGFISMSTVYSAGALLSNVYDLYRWHQALYSGKLVKMETLQKAIHPFTLSDGTISDYGYGFFIKKVNDILSIGHGGAIDGFRAMELYFPEKDLYIAYLCNSEQDNFIELFMHVANLAIGKENITFKDLKIPDEQLETYIGNYTFQEDKKQFIKIYKRDGRLYADLSNGSGLNMALLAQSDTLFYLPDVVRIPTTIEFILTAGKVTGLYWTQEKQNEAHKNQD